MATTTKTSATDMPDLAQKAREQLVSAVQQGQKFSVDATQTWVRALSVLPTPELRKVPGAPSVPGVEAATTYTFDVATDLLNAQRDFTLQLANVLASASRA